MADYDLTSLDEQKPDGAVDQVLALDDSEQETRRKLKGWANIEHSLTDGTHTFYVSADPPETPTKWQLWYNTNTEELLVFQVHPYLFQWRTAQQPTFNYLYNSGFNRFANPSSVPVGWHILFGSSAIGTAFPAGVGMTDPRQKFGPYALIVNSGDSPFTVYQTIGQVGSAFGPPDYWRGRTVAFGCWVLTSTPEKVRLIIRTTGWDYDAVSAYHPGGDTWEWLVAWLKIPDYTSVTGVSARFSVEDLGITAIFSGPTFVDGSWCSHVLPSGLLLRSELLHMGSMSGTSDLVPGGTVYYGPNGSSASVTLALAIAPYDCFVSNLRVYIPNGAGAGKSYTATLMINTVATAMTCAIVDTNTFNFDNSNKVRIVAGDRLSLRIIGTAGANAGPLRASVLIEEVPLALA